MSGCILDQYLEEDKPELELARRLHLYRLTQTKLKCSDMAKLLGWTANKVCEFENTCEGDMKYLELLSYLRAVGVPLDIDVVDKETNEVMANLT